MKAAPLIPWTNSYFIQKAFQSPLSSKYLSHLEGLQWSGSNVLSGTRRWEKLVSALWNSLCAHVQKNIFRWSCLRFFFKAKTRETCPWWEPLLTIIYETLGSGGLGAQMLLCVKLSSPKRYVEAQTPRTCERDLIRKLGVCSYHQVQMRSCQLVGVGTPSPTGAFIRKHPLFRHRDTQREHGMLEAEIRAVQSQVKDHQGLPATA